MPQNNNDANNIDFRIKGNTKTKLNRFIFCFDTQKLVWHIILSIRNNWFEILFYQSEISGFI